ncbi:MAG: hypothetical protein QW112_03745 [Candidatus Micrarchaeia archaeon]
MTEVRMSDEGVYSIIIKGFILLIIAWILGILLYVFVQLTLGYQKLNEAVTNTEFLLLLLAASIMIVFMVCLVIGKLLQASISIETREKEILIRKGMIIPREFKVQYTELKEARLSSTIFDFIDSFFDVSAISIEDSKVLIVNGVKNPIVVVKEINDKIATSKRKGLTLEDFAKEIKSLRDEVDELKKTIPKKKEIRPEPMEKGRSKFGIGPLDETV